MAQPPKILCVSANPAIDRRLVVPHLRLAEVNRATMADPAAGGKAAHVAFAAQTLGAEVRWMAFLGGAEGEACRAGVAARGITPVVIPIEGRTRMNLELIDSDTAEVTEVLEPGPAIAAKDASKFLDEFAKQCEDRPEVVISGSLPKGLAPDFYAQLITTAKQQGCRVLLDTSGEALSLGLHGHPDVIKPNRQEASSLLRKQIRTREDAQSAARELRALGIGTVLVSLGEDGALADTDKETLIAIPPKIKARSTVGSGDSFLAGWTVASAQGKPVADCLRLAIACGTANCLAESPALFTLEAVNEFLSQAQVFPLRS